MGLIHQAVFRTLIISIGLFAVHDGLSAQVIHRFDIIIDEVFPDPSPSVGLPNAEFIELRNMSNEAVDLQHWQITTLDDICTIKTSFILRPDSLVIVCSTASLPDYQTLGAAIGVSGFPSLGNDRGILSLLSPSGQVIHSLSYDKAWYENEMKMQGGWSLEMIDPHNPCSGAKNWTASVSPQGGSPGKINSVNGQNPDSTAPKLISTVCLSSNQVLLFFDEPLDSGSASVSGHYALSQLGEPQFAEPSEPLFDKVKLQFASILDSTVTYQMSVHGLSDCAGNANEEVMTRPVSISRHADPLDLVINEILFNPAPNGYDYLEIYNRSGKAIDLRNWSLANRKADGSLYNFTRLSDEARLIFPGDYLVFSEDILWISQQYLVKYPENLIQLESLPSLPDDEGDLVLLDQEGTLIDEVSYHHQWHSPLLANEEGVALERLNVNQPTQDPANWSSAASTAGFGTPTYRNSEFAGELMGGNSISVSPKIFSPDNDGYEDFAFLHYQFEEAGYIGNVTIFNSSGIPVRYLARSATFSREGSIRWDGLDENQQRLPMGIYIVYAEIFNLKGELRRFKSALTLAARLN